MISIARIVASNSGKAIHAGMMWREFSAPSLLKEPKKEIGSWFMASIPSISDKPFQVQIHSVRGQIIRVSWPDKDSGIHCYPYCLDEDQDSILIEKNVEKGDRVKSYLRKIGVPHSTHGDRIRVSRADISVDGDFLNVYKRDGDTLLGTFSVSRSGIDSAVALCRKVHQPRRIERISTPRLIEDDESGCDVRVRTTYVESTDD